MLPCLSDRLCTKAAIIGESGEADVVPYHTVRGEDDHSPSVHRSSGEERGVDMRNYGHKWEE